MFFDYDTILVPNHVDHSFISIILGSSSWPVHIYSWVFTLCLLWDKQKLCEPWRNLLGKTKDWKHIQRCCSFTMVVTMRREAKSHKDFSSSCFLLELISSLFGFAVYLNADLGLSALSSWYSSVLLFASFRLFFSLPCVSPSILTPCLCSSCHPHLGTSFLLFLVCSHPNHASGGDARF